MQLKKNYNEPSNILQRNYVQFHFKSLPAPLTFMALFNLQDLEKLLMILCIYTQTHTHLFKDKAYHDRGGDDKRQEFLT